MKTEVRAASREDSVNPSTVQATPLPYLKPYRATGADASDFLQGQLTADLDALAPDESTFAAWCSPRGQVIGLLLVRRDADGWLMIGRAGLIEPLIERMRRFVLRAEVGFEPLDRGIAGVGDPGAPAQAGDLTPAGCPLRYRVTDPAETHPDRADVNDWRRRELEQGVLWLDPETSERFIPQMLGLERIGALSYRKGCYPGQEVVARAHYLGKVKRHALAVGLEAGEAPSPGSACTLAGQDAEAGGVVADSVATANDSTFAVVVTGWNPETPLESFRGESDSPTPAWLWPDRD